MRVFDWIGQRVGSLFRSAGTLVARLDGLWNVAGGSGGRGNNTREWLETVQASGRIRSAIDRYAKDIAGVRWKLMRRGSEGQLDTELKGHALLDWMRHPWRSLGGGSWWSLTYLTEAWLQADGNCFWFMPATPEECQEFNRPFEVWPIPPHWVQGVPTPEFPFYSVVMNRKEEIPSYVPARRMIWMRKPNLLNPFGRGSSPLHAIDDEVVWGEACSKYLNTFFRNQARPDVVLFAQGASEPDVQRLEEQFEKRHRGHLKAFRPAVIKGDGKLFQVSQSFADMTLVELKRMNRDEQWQVFGLSPDIMGAVENSNRASIEAAGYHHQLYNLKPEVVFLEGELNLWVVPMFGDPDLYLQAEEVVQITEEMRVNRAEKGYLAGLLERNEARSVLGSNPLEEARGRMVGQPVNTIQIGPDGKPQPWPSSQDQLRPEQKKMLRQLIEALKEDS